MRSEIKKQFQTVFERLRDPLLLVDASGSIIDFNPAARSSLDIDESEHIRDVTSLEPGYVFDSEQVLGLLARAKPVFGFRFNDPDGNPSNAVADIIELDTKNGKDALRLIHIKNFSSLKNYERWKDELISMVAHEIKNPLTAMKNSMNILISQAPGPVTDGQHKLLTTSIRGIDRLTRLLEGFLDVSRISAGNYSLEPRWVDIREFIPDVMSSFKTLFNVSRQKLEYRISHEIERVYIDSPKLEQVLINLLSNAIKFTPQGGEVHVEAERANLEAVSDKLRILPWKEICETRFFRLTVKDTGIGMGGDTLAHLFTRYYKSAEGGGLKGSHLGLSISKTLTEVQNGNLRIESEPGVGTEVTVYLPEDEKTALVVKRLKSIERCLVTVSNRRKSALFMVLRKRETHNWRDVLQDWSRQPLVNPSAEEERNENFLMWTLGERIAVVLSAEEKDPPSTLSPPELNPAGDETRVYSIGRCRIPDEGTRVTQLMNMALNRMRFQPQVTVKS